MSKLTSLINEKGREFISRPTSFSSVQISSVGLKRKTPSLSGNTRSLTLSLPLKISGWQRPHARGVARHRLLARPRVPAPLPVPELACFAAVERLLAAPALGVHRCGCARLLGIDIVPTAVASAGCAWGRTTWVYGSGVGQEDRRGQLLWQRCCRAKPLHLHRQMLFDQTSPFSRSLLPQIESPSRSQSTPKNPHF